MINAYFAYWIQYKEDNPDGSATRGDWWQGKASLHSNLYIILSRWMCMHWLDCTFRFTLLLNNLLWTLLLWTRYTQKHTKYFSRLCFPSLSVKLRLYASNSTVVYELSENDRLLVFNIKLNLILRHARCDVATKFRCLFFGVSREVSISYTSLNNFKAYLSFMFVSPFQFHYKKE
jgi:hypothetical protein